MSDARIYKNRRLTLTHLSDELFDGRVVCAAHVAIQPGLIAADFDMVGGIGDDEQTAKRDAFRRAMALIEYIAVDAHLPRSRDWQYSFSVA